MNVENITADVIDKLDPNYHYYHFLKCEEEAKKLIMGVACGRTLLIGERTWKRNVSNGFFEWKEDMKSNEVPRDVAEESVAFDLFENKKWRYI